MLTIKCTEKKPYKHTQHDVTVSEAWLPCFGAFCMSCLFHFFNALVRINTTGSHSRLLPLPTVTFSHNLQKILQLHGLYLYGNHTHYSNRQLEQTHTLLTHYYIFKLLWVSTVGWTLCCVNGWTQRDWREAIINKGHADIQHRRGEVLATCHGHHITHFSQLGTSVCVCVRTI